MVLNVNKGYTAKDLGRNRRITGPIIKGPVQENSHNTGSREVILNLSVDDYNQEITDKQVFIRESNGYPNSDLTSIQAVLKEDGNATIDVYGRMKYRTAWEKLDTITVAGARSGVLHLTGQTFDRYRFDITALSVDLEAIQFKQHG